MPANTTVAELVMGEQQTGFSRLVEIWGLGYSEALIKRLLIATQGISMPSKANSRQRVSDLKLPPMPESLQTIRAERAKASPDLDHVIDTIAKDVSMAGEVLKTINSPLFSPRQPVSSIPNAVMMMGLGNVLNLCAAVSLRQTMQCTKGNLALDRFWDTANDVAIAASLLARHLSGIPADMAYTLGLFHDSGIPVMMCHHADYVDTLKQGEQGDLVALEKQRYGVSHTQVGSHISKSWGLPRGITAAIMLHHHFPEAVAREEELGEDVISLIGLLKMAEHISKTFRGLAFRNQSDDMEWEAIGEMVLSHFELDSDDFSDLKERLLSELGEG